MAEPIIVGTTRLTFTALISTARGLKKLRDGMKKAPEDIEWLSQEVHSVQLIVEYLEPSIRNSSDDASDAAMLLPFLNSCRTEFTHLDGLIQALSVDLCSKQWDRRATAQFKAVMEGERLQHYRRRLKDAARRLMNAQQAYFL